MSTSKQAASHSKKGWEQFTAAVLCVVVSRLASEEKGHGGNGVVFMAWGAHAAKMCVGIDEVRLYFISTSSRGSSRLSCPYTESHS